MGNILALTSISFNTSASLCGRALADTAAVTLQMNAIANQNCAGQAGSTGFDGGLDVAGDGTVSFRAPAIVPLPASFLLLLSTLGGLGFFWKRRRA